MLERKFCVPWTANFSFNTEKEARFAGETIASL